MAIHWQVKFKSLRAGTDYTVNIYDANYSGNPIPLKGGAEPFVTQEDDDEDMFLPVRTQSGYIRIVDDGKDANGNAFNWKDLLPSTDVDRPVTLTAATGTVLWHGFMQAQNFTGVLYGNPQEREFPVQCPLTVLSANDISANEREMKTFGYVIAQAFSSIPTLTFDNFIFQGGADAREWLLKLVDWQNYVTSEDDETVQARFDYGLVLEDICKYWGWSCRVYRQSVIFCRVDDNDVEPNALVLTLAELGSLTSNSGTVETFLSAASLPTDVFVSVDNDETLVRGYRKATVHANAGEGDTAVIKAYPDGVEKKIEESGLYYTVQYDDAECTYKGKLLTAESAFMSFQCREGYGSLDYLISNHNPEGMQPGPMIRILKSYTGINSNAYVSIRTKFAHSYYDPRALSILTYSFKFGLRFTGTIGFNGFDYQNADGTRGNNRMVCRLGIGMTRNTAKWWDGRRWTDSETAFPVLIGNTTNEFIVAVIDGTSLYRLYFKNVPTNADNMYGYIFLDFLGSDDMPEIDGERVFDIKDFKVEFVRFNTYNNLLQPVERNNSYNYSANAADNERNDWDSDLVYASDNKFMAFGYGIPINPDGKQMKLATYGSSQEIPEQNMANRVAAYWGTSKRKITADLNTAVIPAITPRKTVTLDGTDCYPISITNDWWNDKTTLTLLQL
mgnify:FL=1